MFTLPRKSRPLKPGIMHRAERSSLRNASGACFISLKFSAHDTTAAKPDPSLWNSFINVNSRWKPSTVSCALGDLSVMWTLGQQRDCFSSAQWTEEKVTELLALLRLYQSVWEQKKNDSKQQAVRTCSSGIQPKYLSLLLLCQHKGLQANEQLNQQSRKKGVCHRNRQILMESCDNWRYL